MGKIVLAGNPNCGKTSVFNLLTGLNRKVSNLAGTTVEVGNGLLKVNDRTCELIDLPGTYSIYPNSNEEKESINYILDNKESIDLLVYVADANQLFRNFLFLSQLLSLEIPTVIVANMWDKVNKRDSEMDLNRIATRISIPILPFSSRSIKELPLLQNFISQHVNSETTTDFFRSNDYPPMEELVKSSNNTSQVNRSNHTLFLYKRLSSLFSDNKKDTDQDSKRTYKWDKVLLHPKWGFAIFALVMFLMFQLLFPLAEYPMDLIDSFFNKLSIWITHVLPSDNWFTSLIVNGIIPGVAGVVIFIPQIVLLFLFLGLLEDSGYVSRISFLLDSTLRKVGLNGKSVIPMVGGFACSIPAIMSARTIVN